MKIFCCIVTVFFLFFSLIVAQQEDVEISLDGIASNIQSVGTESTPGPLRREDAQMWLKFSRSPISALIIANCDGTASQSHSTYLAGVELVKAGWQVSWMGEPIEGGGEQSETYFNLEQNSMPGDSGANRLLGINSVVGRIQPDLVLLDVEFCSQMAQFAAISITVEVNHVPTFGVGNNESAIQFLYTVLDFDDHDFFAQLPDLNDLHDRLNHAVVHYRAMKGAMMVFEKDYPDLAERTSSFERKRILDFQTGVDINEKVEHYTKLGGNFPPFRALVISGGSRGDTQPVFALGAEMIQSKLFQCDVVCAPEFAEFGGDIGFENVHQFDLSFKKVVQEDEELSAVAKTGDILKLFQHFSKYIIDPEHKAPRLLKSIFDNAIAEQRPYDVVLVSSTEVWNGIALSETYKVPTILVSMQPWYASQLFPAAMTMPPFPTEPQELAAVGGNFWSFFFEMSKDSITKAFKEVFSLDYDWTIEDYAAHLASTYRYTQVAGMYSETVLPRPPDVQRSLQVYGPSVLPAQLAGNWIKVSPQLEAFVGAGSEPIYFGFGSMALGPEFKKILTEAVVVAAFETNHRAIVFSGWQDLQIEHFPRDAYPQISEQWMNENVIFVDHIDQDWVFQRCKIVQIHGGAGTTAAGLRSGRPLIVSPYLVDQFWFAHVINLLGVGKETAPIYKLTSNDLVASIQHIENDYDTFQQNAIAIKKRLLQEKGTYNALKEIVKVAEFAQAHPGEFLPNQVTDQFDFSKNDNYMTRAYHAMKNINNDGTE